MISHVYSMIQASFVYFQIACRHVFASSKFDFFESLLPNWSFNSLRCPPLCGHWLDGQLCIFNDSNVICLLSNCLQARLRNASLLTFLGHFYLTDHSTALDAPLYVIIGSMISYAYSMLRTWLFSFYSICMLVVADLNFDRFYAFAKVTI